jgi:hypothetical protein
MNVENLFNSDNKEKDLVALIDCAYDIMELWNPTEMEIYNRTLKAAWLKRARELGAVSRVKGISITLIRLIQARWLMSSILI